MMFPLQGNLPIIAVNTKHSFHTVIFSKPFLMVKFYQCVLAFFLLPCAIQAQDEILMRIHGKPVTKSEFERIYHKNNAQENASDPAQIRDYLTLFVNFKLKVTEAEQLGLDTLASFRQELQGYRDQLARSYLKDTIAEEEFARQEYERMKWEVKAAHIFVRCPIDAAPEDTLKAWNKLAEASRRLKKGEPFEKVARELSEDPSTAPNGGSLGYFTALSMIYPFENAAYSLQPGQISAPLRSSAGYHLIKLYERRPSRGEVRVAHIMKAVPRGSGDSAFVKAEKEIAAIYDSLLAGKDFSEMASRYSDDKYSGMQGGALPWFAAGRMVPEFQEAAFALQNPGEISKPIRTPYGYHIIKLLEKRTLAPYEELRSALKNQISQMGLSSVVQEATSRKLKAEYGFTEYPEALKAFYQVIDSSFLKNKEKWGIDHFKGMNSIMFTIADERYTQQDFARFILDRGQTRKRYNPYYFVTSLYKDFTENMLQQYQKNHLEEKYPEFRYLMQEYHDGILLFDLTDKVVWSKAATDTAGLEAFYKKNMKKYQWGERLDAAIYTCKDSTTALKAIKLAPQREKKRLSAEWLAAKVCPEDTARSCVKIEELKVEKGDNPVVEKAGWSTGISGLIPDNGKVVFVVKRKMIPPSQKTLQEARGLVIADYQDELEKRWVEELRAKYKVEINEEVLGKVK